MSTLHDLRYRAKQYATGQLPAGSPTPKLPKKSAAAAAAVPVKSSLRGGRASAPTVDDHSKSTPPTSRSYTSAISQAGSAVAAVAAASQDESKAARGQTSTLSAGPYQMQQQPHTQQHTQSRSRTHSTAPSTAPSHQSNHPASTNPASRGTSNHSYQGEDDYYSGSEYSDSGCSTCSGSRHGDYSSASRTPSRSPSRSTRFTPASDHPQPYHRYTPQSHRTGTETFSDDHADCISCTSSCSCTSGCDSEDDQDPGEKRFHSSSAAAGGGGRGRGNSRRHSHGGAQSKSRSPNRAPSHAVSAAQSKYGSNVALQVNTQRNAAGSPLHYSDVDMILESPISRGGSGHAKAVAKEAMLLSTGDESARFAVMEEGDDSDQWKVSEETQAVPGMRRGSTISQSSAHAAGSNPDGRSSTAQRETAALERAQRETAALDRALRDEMHVAFMTPRDGERDDDMHGMTVAQRREIYEGALACITRAEKGFHTYVLSSEQARSAAENPDVYSTALLRKLLRYEPRRSTHASSLSGSSPLSNKRAPFSAASAASASVGSGNLAYYDLRVEEGGNAPARFKLSRAEQEEVERMRRMERERDLEGKSDLDATTVAGESPFMAAHYAQLLQSRKGLSLILSRKAGLLPIRRIRSLRLGILPAAREFLHAVKARMEELSLDEGEEWREECCVSVLMDSGIKSQHVHGASAAAGAASFTSAHDEHHQTCISQYDPALCPRVPSSFVKARTGQGVKVKREIRRNERKMGVRPAWGVNQPAQQQQANVEQHQPSLAASLNSSFLNHSATAPQISTAHHSPSFPSHHVSSQQWYILCTASPEEASQLLNALMVMKLMAGKRMERRRDQEEKRKKNERVVLPPTGSPLRKRSKLRHQDQSSRVDVLEPMELTEVLMNAARKVQTAEAQRPTPAAAASSTATATASATPSAQNSQRSFLKRKSVPTLPLPAPAAAPAPAAKARKPVRQPSLSPVERLSRNWQEAKVASKFAPVGSPQRAREKGIRPQEEDSEEERPIDTKTAHQAAAAAASSAAAAVAHEAKEIAPMEFTIEETHLEETDIDQTMVDTQPAQPSQAQQMSSTAIFVPTQFHATVPQPTSQVSAASQRSTRSTARSNTHSLTGVSNPTVTSHTPSTAPASVQEWLERKSMRAEALKRQQAEEAEEKRQAEERKKIESAEALRKWEERQEKLEKQKAEQAAKIKAEKQAKAAAKKEETATRKALCMAAYAKFLARSEENRLKHEQESKEKAAKTSLEERRKKRAARTKYEEWVRKKSDWFVGRIQSIRKRAAARKKQGTAGAVDEEDPDGQSKMLSSCSEALNASRSDAAKEEGRKTMAQRRSRRPH
jgi:hypothetical protein